MFADVVLFTWRRYKLEPGNQRHLRPQVVYGEKRDRVGTPELRPSRSSSPVALIPTRTGGSCLRSHQGSCREPLPRGGHCWPPSRESGQDTSCQEAWGRAVWDPGSSTACSHGGEDASQVGDRKERGWGGLTPAGDGKNAQGPPPAVRSQSEEGHTT